MSLYPRLMHRGGEEITVTSEADQQAREADGWRAADGSSPELEPEPQPEPEPDVPDAAAAEDGADEGPTFGPPHDQTHAKRSKKKK